MTELKKRLAVNEHTQMIWRIVAARLSQVRGRRVTIAEALGEIGFKELDKLDEKLLKKRKLRKTLEIKNEKSESLSKAIGEGSRKK